MLEEIDRFLSSQGRRWSVTTVRRYGWYLQNLAAWLEDERPGEVTERVLLHWLDARMGWASSTQYTATIACRQFFRWKFGRDRSPQYALLLVGAAIYLNLANK